jgi:hypothetical protein
VTTLLLDQTLPSAGFRHAFYNDVGGVAPIAADSDFELGEIWVGDVQEWRIRPTFQSGIEDYSKTKLSISGQPFRISRRVAKTSSIEVTPAAYDSAFGAGSMNELRARLASAAPCVVFPVTAQPFTGSAAIEQDYVNRHAEFGFATTLGPIIGEALRFVFSARFKAPPVLLP